MKKDDISIFFPCFRKMDYRRFLLCCTLVIVTSMINPFQGRAADSVRVAAIFSLTGIAAKHNAPMVKMVELAVHTINENGGLLGRPVKLLILDNQSTPIGSAKAARKAVGLDTIAVIGGHWSSHSLAMAPILQQYEIPMISPASTNPEITRDRDYIFRACFVDSFQGRAMASFARNTLGARRAVVLSNVDEKYSLTLASFFRDVFVEQSGEIAADIQYRGDATDFSDIISQIRPLEVDVIYLPGYTRDSGLFIKQARKSGIKAIFLGADGWDEIGEFATEAINGSYQTAAWHPMVPYPESRELKELYNDYYHTPITNFNSPLAYDAVMLLQNAINRCQCLKRSKIKESLQKIESFRGATGVISFDDHGNPKEKEVIIIQFEDDEPVFKEAVWP